MFPRRVLLVDDQRETTRMLRTMLEFLDRSYVIVDVPSGEEALLEVRRGPFNLLITDVRLPGISGLELVERVRKANSEARVIIISGLSDPELREAARDLEADAFFAKPLDTENFMQTVQAMLAGPPRAESPTDAPAPAVQVDEETAVSDRLLLLRRDLGALAVFLADEDARVVMSAGDVARLDVAGSMNHLMVAFSAALKLCAALGNPQPANVQFFDGTDFDLYTINVGLSYLLVIVYEDERGARAMGPVMTYGRQCAEELRQALAGLESELAPAPQPPLAEPPTAEAEPPAEVEPLPAAEPALEELLRQSPEQDADAFWEAALADSGEEKTSVNALTYEQAQTLGLLPKDL
jgi:CheY-like chemotaxis protein